MTSVPLNGRSFTDLLALQPGIVPANSQRPNREVMAGVASTPPSGGLNPGNLSISGQRETTNGFVVNGGNVEETVNMGVAIIPNLDSIAEFRVLTNNFDAEDGNYSGGQIVVTTKSGTNQFHGDGFKFLRNTALDARNFFSADRARFAQNQFGGTLGGPLKRDKIFFFADSQRTGMTQGSDTGLIRDPSLEDRAGNLQGLSSALTGTVNSQSLGESSLAKARLRGASERAVLQPELYERLAMRCPECDHPSKSVVRSGPGTASVHSTVECGRRSILHLVVRREAS